MEREVGEGIGMGNTCKPMAVSFQCMTKFTTKKKKSKIGQKTDKNSGAKRLRGSRVQDKARERIINKGNQGKA